MTGVGDALLEEELGEKTLTAVVGMSRRYFVNIYALYVHFAISSMHIPQ